MFNQSELNSAASAIAGAYRLVNFACTSQAIEDWESNTILECEAILLKFRCYYQGGELTLSHSPHSVNSLFAPQERNCPTLPGQSISLLPINSRERLTEQEEEEKLIKQIESALMRTIANMDERDKADIHEAETHQVETRAVQTHEVELHECDSRKTGLPDQKTAEASFCQRSTSTTGKLRNLQRLLTDECDSDDTLKKQFARVLLNLFLTLFNRLSAHNQLRLVPILDSAAHLSYAFGLKRESLALHHRALNSKHDWWGRKHIGRAFNLDAIARICSEFGELEKAESSYTEAETLREIYQQKHDTIARKLQWT